MHLSNLMTHEFLEVSVLTRGALGNVKILFCDRYGKLEIVWVS